MAYSKTPENDTYSSVRVPLLADITYDKVSLFHDNVSHHGGYTTGMTNVLPFKRKTINGQEEIVGITRYGIKSGYVAEGFCRGIHVWEKSPGVVYIFVVVSTGGNGHYQVYSTNDVNYPWNLLIDFTTNTPNVPVRFEEFITSASVKSLIVTDGFDGYVITDHLTATKITDPDFPTPHVPFPVFLNGRLYLAKKGTGDIYCSDLDHPETWTPGNFISSEVYPDDVKALVKVNNYILAIGKEGSEFFYDAAIATGSPLARYEGASLPFGTIFPDTIASTKDSVVLLATTSDGESILKYVEGFNHTDLPDTFYVNQLNMIRSGGGVTPVVPNRFIGYFFRQRGKMFYVLTFDQADEYAAAAFPTFCYSFDTQLWTFLSISRNNEKEDYTDYGFPVTHTAPTSGVSNVTYVGGRLNGLVFFGSMSAIHTGYDSMPINNDPLEFSNYYWYVNRICMSGNDFGTMNKKAINRIGVASFNVQDDEATKENGLLPKLSWSFTRPANAVYEHSRMLDSNTSVASGEFPFITQVGTGREIWVMLETYGSNIFHHLEFDINKGQQ